MDNFVTISSTQTGDYGSAIAAYVFAVISLILSIILLFFGKRLLRLSLGIIGFLTFGSIPVIIWMRSYSPYISSTYILIIVVTVGLVAAFIVSYFTKFGIYIIGATSGGQFGCLLSEIIYRDSVVLFITLSILFFLAGLILPYFFMDYMVIEITTFNGFMLFRSAIMYTFFAAITGQFMVAYISYSSGIYWWVLFGSLFFWILGFLYQHKKYKNYPYLKNMKTKEVADERC